MTDFEYACFASLFDAYGAEPLVDYIREMCAEKGHNADAEVLKEALAQMVRNDQQGIS